MNIYENNLKYIKQNHSEILKYLNQINSENRFKRIDLSEHIQNVYDCKYEVQIHKDIKTELLELNNYNFDNAHLIILFGIGTGAYIKLLLKKYPHKHFVIIEKDKDYFNYFIQKFDFSEILKEKNILILVDENPNDISKCIERYYNLLLYSNIQNIENNSQVRIYNSYYEAVKENLKILFQTSIKNYATLKKFLQDWEKNILNNLDIYIKYPDISKLYNIFPEIPCLLIGAGPSLNDKLKLINQNQRKFIIVSVDTAARALINNNIIPDIIVSIDSQIINFNYLVNLKFDYSFLIAPPLILNQTFRLFNDNIFLFNYGIPLLDYIDEKLNKFCKTAILGSVSTSGLDISAQLGCSPIILLGCDFGFNGIETHNTTSIRDKLSTVQINKFSTFETVLYSNFNNENIIRIEGNKGMINTTTDLLIWKNWFEEQINSSKLDCINCAEFGAKLKGVKYENFKYVCSRYSELNFNKYEILKKKLTINYDENIRINLINEIIDYLKERLKKIEIIDNRIKKDKKNENYYFNRFNNYLLELILDRNKKNILCWDVKMILHKNNYFVDKNMLDDVIDLFKKKLAKYSALLNSSPSK